MKRENYAINLLTWQKEQKNGQITFYYPYRKEAKGAFAYGFLLQDDTTFNFTGWEGIFLTLERKKAEEEKLKITVEVREVTSHQTRERELKFERFLPAKEKELEVKAPFSDFSVELCKENIWNFVKKITISVSEDFVLKKAEVRRKSQIYIDMPIKGKAADTGEEIVYDGLVCNCSGQRLAISAMQQFQGWESMKAQIVLGGMNQEGMAVLEPYGITKIHIHLKMVERVVAGGHEDTWIQVVSQGSTSASERICLKTVKTMAHPFLYHDQAGWKGVKEKIARYPAYQPAYEKLLTAFEGWEVKPPESEKPYCYETQIEDAVMSSAYLYAVTQEKKYGEKIVKFLNYFSNRETGYPVRLRGCSQSYVQEGHFFAHLVLAYDIIFDSGLMTEKEKEAFESCIRIYMELLDNHLREGHISNWLLSEISAAVYGALVLEDLERAERFVFGNGGAVDQFRYGVFNDGWWHECSVGYNTWVSSLLLHIAHAMRPFGYNLIDEWFAIPYNDEVDSTWACKDFPYRFAMCNKKRGAYHKNYMRIKDMFDATVPYLDERGVLFGIADSDEKKLGDMHWGSTYDLAYFYYHDPAYQPIIQRNGYQDIAFGMMPLLEEEREEPKQGKGAYSDNIGIVMLRTQKEGRKPFEQIQAVLRYGSHGYAHGHFDIASLLSVMRYGRSLYNPENCWWGYAHFMYKFYVQCSLTKNMVVVDEKMQLPADSERILFYQGKKLQAAGVRTKAAWAYPPYGGMAYCGDTKEDLKKRTKQNHSYLPILTGKGSPKYGEISEQTKEVDQVRIMALTEDYIVLFDKLSAQEEHQYDCLYQIKGFLELKGNSVKYQYHTPQWNPNPRSDAQFVTDCHWYQVKGESKAAFLTLFTEEDAGEAKRCDRSNYNIPGKLYTDVYTAWPKNTVQMTGKVAVYKGWAALGNGYTIPLRYRIELDKTIVRQGEFDGWILGKDEVCVSLKGVKELKIYIWNGDSSDELGNPVTTPQAIFLGFAELEKEDGTIVKLSDLNYQTENIDSGFGIGRDYQNGRVLIQGEEYPYAIPCAPLHHEAEGIITVRLNGRFTCFRFCIGIDAFPGKETNDRITYAIRTKGKEVHYITVLEPYEKTGVIERIEGICENVVRIYRKDGDIEEVELFNTGTKYNVSYQKQTKEGKIYQEKSV